MAFRLANILILTVCATVVSACDDDTRVCTDQGCAPGYQAHLESPDTVLEPGQWQVDLDLDGATVTAKCAVTGPTEGPEHLACELGPWTNESSRPLTVWVSVGEWIGPGSGEPTDTGVPPETSNEGIFVSVYADDGQAPFTTLDIAVSFEGTAVFETQVAPSYEVQEDFGGPGCGSCIRDVEDRFMMP